MTEFKLPKYESAIETEKIRHHKAKIKYFSKFNYKHCLCHRKRLKKIWKGSHIHYHVMACVDCGLAQIWPAEKDTGIILMDEKLSYPNDKFFKLVRDYNERHNCKERQSNDDD